MPEAQIKSSSSDTILNNDERQKRIEELRKMIEGKMIIIFNYLLMKPF